PLPYTEPGCDGGGAKRRPRRWGDDYVNLDGGEEFRVGHRFSCRKAVHMAVKNYNIRRAAEYTVLESDQYRYVCCCKQHEAGCPWRVRVAMRTNHGYW
ncbi:hypothetical protein PIB30_114773, partial [Stylosanthes scabra]|nr:hypothetical protein [Stylosanthes scabra]